MTYDVGRYNSLISRAAINWEYFRGHYQDMGPNRYHCTIGGAGIGDWSIVNGLPARRNNTGCPVMTPAIASVVDATGAFSVEFVAAGSHRDGILVLSQELAGGWYCSSAAGNYYLATRTAAMGLGRYIAFGTSAAQKSTDHYAATINTAALTGAAWRNGVPIAVAFVNLGVPSNSAVRAVYGHFPSLVGTQIGVLDRAYPFALTNEDAACLFGAAHAMFGV